MNVFAYAGTMEYSRGRRTLERTRRVDLDVNYRSPGPDVPMGKGEGKRDWSKERGKKGERGRKEDTDSIASAKPDWTALSSSPS